MRMRVEPQGVSRLEPPLCSKDSMKNESLTNGCLFPCTGVRNRSKGVACGVVSWNPESQIQRALQTPLSRAFSPALSGRLTQLTFPVLSTQGDLNWARRAICLLSPEVLKKM